MGNKQRDKFLLKHKITQIEAEKTVNNRFLKFSFEFCTDSTRGIAKARNAVKLATINKLILLSQSTWQGIKYLRREQGFEKIEKSYFDSLPNIPNKFIEEKKITVCRLPSKIGRLIGYIDGDTFFIVWIDTKFNMYSH